ncbi:MAG: SAM-dependent DNA methyltransferase, partial [Comamonas sp.]|nr:SAM-dependent DNA methyltransferase [Comamonas sp.]
MSKLADLIWKNAELLRGAYKENEYRKVILPFTILRRLDCVLEPTRAAVQARYEAIRSKGYDLDKMLTPVSKYPFFNTSPFTLPKIAETPDDVRDNLEAMVNGFSQNVRDIFEKFGFAATLDKLDEKNRLYLVAQRFAETDLSPEAVTNHDMGQAFEELLRKFNDVSPAGEQYTPRDVIELMVTLLFNGDDEVLSVPGVVRTMYDPTAGTGGILSVAEEHLRKFNDRATLKLFGQELEDETYAICKADMLIRGQDPANIMLGDTLALDMHPSKTFEYQAANPPYGVEWKPAQDAVKREHAKGAAGRFAPGLPAIRDGQMLFSLHLLSKMQPVVAGKGGGRIGVVHNGSPLFTGDAGSGESEIRRHILGYDYLDCIVALPTDMFYNTNITTYLWFMTNRKPAERKGKVMLIDASAMSTLMKKNLGKKRREFTPDCVERIAKAYAEFQSMEWHENPEDKTGRLLKAKVF